MPDEYGKGSKHSPVSDKVGGEPAADVLSALATGPMGVAAGRTPFVNGVVFVRGCQAISVLALHATTSAILLLELAYNPPPPPPRGHGPLPEL